MIKFKIKTGDKVIVLSGNHKGKIGIVKQVYPKNAKILVSGINIITRRVKAGDQANQGKIIKKESPLHISKVALLDLTTGKPTKVGLIMKEGKKIRFLKKSGKYLENVINQKQIS